MKWYLYDSGINLILIKKIKHKSFKNLLVTLLSKLDYVCTFYLTWLRILQSCFWSTDGPYFALTTFHLQKRYWTELNFLNKRIIQIYTFTLYVEQMLTLNKIPQLRPFFFCLFMEVPRLRVESELHLPAYATAVHLKLTQHCKNKIQKDTCTPVFTAALWTIAKSWKQHKYVTIHWQRNR